MRRLLVLAAPLLVAACASPATGPASTGSAPSPAVAAAAPAAATAAEAGDALLGRWTWQRKLVGNEPPDAPDQFTIEFLAGGKYNARVDCNTGGGSWIVDDSKLRMTAIRLAKMVCPPGWKDREFSSGIERAQTWAVSKGELVITTGGVVGTMRFRPLPR